MEQEKKITKEFTEIIQKKFRYVERMIMACLTSKMYVSVVDSGRSITRR